jgi:hypothetical protein
MEHDRDKVDEVTLALFWLTSFREAGVRRAWKGHDWDTMERLYSQGYVGTQRVRRNRF